MASEDDDSGGTVEDVVLTPNNSDGEDELAQIDLQQNPKKSTSDETSEGRTADEEDGSTEDAIIEVRVPPPQRPWEYERILGDSTVDYVEEEIKHRGGEMWYKIVYGDGRRGEIPFDKLIALRYGPAALDSYENAGEGDESSLSAEDLSTKPAASKLAATKKRARTATLEDDSESEDAEDEAPSSDAKRQRVSQRSLSLRTNTRPQRSTAATTRRAFALTSDNDTSESSANDRSLFRRRGVKKGIHGSNSRATGSSHLKPIKGANFEGSADSELDELAADGHNSNDEFRYDAPKKSSSRASTTRGKSGRNKRISNGSDRDSNASRDLFEPTRRSRRITKATKSMKELLEDDETYAENVTYERQPQLISIRETFQPLASKFHFSVIHNKNCDICGGHESFSNKGPSPLIYCQGCSTSIHKVCLGARSTRDHMVTKIGEENFVMQCRRCTGIANKDLTAPRLDICQFCKESGQGCNPFSSKKSPKQEQKMREENGGDDPITEVDPDLVNNADILLFRCITCYRGFHFEHLTARNDDLVQVENVEDLRDRRFAEYCSTWKCQECLDAPAKVQSLVAWRPSDLNKYISGQTLDMVSEDDKEYLVKWEELSYFKCTWMPGAWVWGVTATAMRAGFARRDEGANCLPKMVEHDAVPEDFLRMEIVLDVKYSHLGKSHTEEIGKARISDVEEVYVKFQGLGYDEVVWERPPNPNETERWADFVAAYNEYIAGKFFKQPEDKLKDRLRQYRALNFNRKILLNEQPACVTGGKMMEYQIEGLNWLLYNFHQEKNVVLADEMGLGKTIQVIAAIATLVNEKPKCWPFLVVVPNSTCPNWRREIKKWAPSLRVVAYYGLRKSRDTAMKFELYPDGCSDMRAHVVVTSFDAPVDDHSRSFFRKVKWAGMIVDEGQRLKNDKNLLYGALSALKVPFRALLTGTPLQNNKRELFNLLQFLNTNMNAAELDEKYQELTNKNLAELHSLIRPYFLRRTKVQVLKFLPPMVQVIVPVTMTVVQKKLYKSILSKSPELIHSIFVKDLSQLRPAEHGSLNNILMQLRKVLCHPFLYSKAIEERSENQKISHRNLVDASAKLQLLEIMLPKLQQRGHRVLIFSQFLMQLDIIEDFLNGLGLSFHRLDGNVGSLEKQKRIDAFNSPNSPLFAFLLSTRAGGVGINLATADTVIIMDPDFNPHQDIQALSRAHRIGQKNKVLVFQLMTKESAEEKIVQIGRKKMALDHVLIESMDADDDVGVDLQSILKHGAQALFDNDDRNDIRYDSTSVEKLLDRTQVEDTNVGDDKSAESQFSFARVWANDVSALTGDVGDPDSDVPATNATIWDKILKQREADAAREAAAQQKLFGRGKRTRQNVNYRGPNLEIESLDTSPEKPRVRLPDAGGSDTDFAMAAESVVDEDSDVQVVGATDPESQLSGRSRRGNPREGKRSSPVRQVEYATTNRDETAKSMRSLSFDEWTRDNGGPYEGSLEESQGKCCKGCGQSRTNPTCSCERRGLEECGFCGLGHFGGLKNCPYSMSEKQVRLMLDDLKKSPESFKDVEVVQAQLKGRIYDLVQEKKHHKVESTPPSRSFQQTPSRRNVTY